MRKGDIPFARDKWHNTESIHHLSSLSLPGTSRACRRRLHLPLARQRFPRDGCTGRVREEYLHWRLGLQGQQKNVIIKWKTSPEGFTKMHQASHSNHLEMGFGLCWRWRAYEAGCSCWDASQATGWGWLVGRPDDGPGSWPAAPGNDQDPVMDFRALKYLKT